MLRRSRFVLIWIAVFSLAASAGPAVGEETDPIPPDIETKLGLAVDPTDQHSPDVVTVKLVPDVSADVLGVGAEHIFDRWYSVPVEPGESAEQALYRIAAMSEVALVELEMILQLDRPRKADPPLDVVQASVPTDPLYPLQWHFPAADIPDAWDTTSGAGAVVAILDSGVSKGGDDLDCHTFVDEFNSVIDVGAPGAADDDTGHGTHVAGTAAQCTDNGIGVAGVAGSASLMPIKFADAAGGTTDTDVAQAIDWARDHGADVANMSFSLGVCPGFSKINDALESAAGAGVVLVAAAGNGADDAGYIGGLRYPACHSDVIAVGATDYNNERSEYSQWGATLDFVAPGGDVFADANNDGEPDGVFQETFAGSPPVWDVYPWDGTSMASPHVAGVVALIRSVEPSATRYQVEQALLLSALDLGPAGWDEEYGHGLVQADAALDVILDSQSPTWSGGSVTATNVGDSEATLTWSGANDDFVVTSYQVWANGSLAATPMSSPYQLTGLEAETTYSVTIEAVDLMGNVSSNGPSTTFTTDEATIDVTAPWWPAGSQLRADWLWDDSVDLSWDDAADDEGVVAYRIYHAGTVVAETSDTDVSVVGLTEGTRYTFRVEGGDAAGNWSTNGPSVTVTTEDWTFPDFPGNASITAPDIFEDEVTFAWTPATDPGGIAEYRIWVDFEYHSTVGTSLTVYGLDAGTQYLVWVEAEDPSGNWSVGPDLWFTTATDFLDTDGSIFERDIAWLSGAGVTKGCNPPWNDLYCPNTNVTRGQMAAFLVRALGLTDDGGGDHFVDDNGSVFESDIDKLATAGVTKGCNPPTNNRFCPGSAVTRAQMAAFLHRALTTL